MSRDVEEHRSICNEILTCEHCGECAREGAMFGEKLGEPDQIVLPSPDIGGDKIDDFCVYFLAQNPGIPEEGEDKLKAEWPDEYLEAHRGGLEHEYMAGQFVRKLGLDMDYVVWENAVRCSTHDNEMNNTLADNCSEWTSKQLSALRPDYIVSVGGWAKNYFDVEDYMQADDEMATMYHYSYSMRMGLYDDHVEWFHRNVLPRMPTRVIG